MPYWAQSEFLYVKRAQKRLGAGVVMDNVGSTTMHRLIEAQHPLLGLRGHMQGSVVCRTGMTLCLNPGSKYVEGDPERTHPGHKR